MSRRLLPLNWLRNTRPRLPKWQARHATRLQSSQSPQASRIDRITSRLPKRLQKYTTGLRNAPLSHVVSFLILHELTAIVPLVALFALFHYTTYVPISYMTENFGDYVSGGIARFERYFSRKGWFGFGQEERTGAGQDGQADGRSHTDEIVDKWKSGDRKYEILMEVALAYAVTKALLPIRIIGSVSATPWFAGVLMRARKMFTRKP
ncbi:mitochondrial seryl-tRNA synthetase [Purpureocillium lavendulum]|uniref:Mitochondrial seryl-tRNA synthetase n=1 Tax=Purpureocillium lavendulum TaxID=1247861 RepID=A0AB34FFQ8_9HYPO|nr:mitochondrial seryl-tRNA synthetase [Purpureocillium lavendulum]